MHSVYHEFVKSDFIFQKNIKNKPFSYILRLDLIFHICTVYTMNLYGRLISYPKEYKEYTIYFLMLISSLNKCTVYIINL